MERELTSRFGYGFWIEKYKRKDSKSGGSVTAGDTVGRVVQEGVRQGLGRGLKAVICYGRTWQGKNYFRSGRGVGVSK